MLILSKLSFTNANLLKKIPAINNRRLKQGRIVYHLQKEYAFYVLDLFNDVEMQSIPKEKYKLYMADPVHPTLDGYSQWWTPKFIKFCEEL